MKRFLRRKKRGSEDVVDVEKENRGYSSDEGVAFQSRSGPSGSKRSRTVGGGQDHSSVRSRRQEAMVYTLKTFWGYDSFRFEQENVIHSALNGKDSFVIMPTGGGKSLCYQLPALMSPGVTIVVTPLLSLMCNQVMSILNLGGGGVPAFAFSSHVNEEATKAAYRELAKIHPIFKLVYVTPEKLVKAEAFLEILQKLYDDGQLARIVIDEAHCVSQWGHDFRPDYKKLGMLRRQFPKTPLMALTATATDKVRLDVMKQLKMKEISTNLFQCSFNRPNLSWIVKMKNAKAKDKFEGLLKLCKEVYKKPKCGIVYCLSQKDTEEVSQYLTSHGVDASFYHAGNNAKDREYVQQNWENGKIRIVCATIAFGMGIDKKNVRFVIHFCAPKSIDGYYQETGRAGRDGGGADCILLYSPKDIGRLNRLVNMPSRGNTRVMKQRSKDKIAEVKQFCEDDSTCRRHRLLTYYGERRPAKCNPQGPHRCDVCFRENTQKEYFPWDEFED
jgi:bloom syndrome protein